MSYEIIYDKQFVKLPDNQFIPMIYSGSNNCIQFDRSSRGRRERSWFAYSWICGGKPYGTAEAILAKVEEERKSLHEKRTDPNDPDPEKSYGYYSSVSIGGSTRNTTFGMWKGLFVTGMKKALTVEQLKEENIYVRVYMFDYNGEYQKKAKEKGLPWLASQTAISTANLLELLEKYETTYKDTGISWYVSYDWDFADRLKWIRKRLFPTKKGKQEYESIKVDQYFTVVAPNGYYFYKRIKYGYKYSPYPQHKFLTEKEAQRFANRIKGRLTLTVEEINEPTVLNVVKK